MRTLFCSYVVGKRLLFTMLLGLCPPVMLHAEEGGQPNRAATPSRESQPPNAVVSADVTRKAGGDRIAESPVTACPNGKRAVGLAAGNQTNRLVEGVAPGHSVPQNLDNCGRGRQPEVARQDGMEVALFCVVARMGHHQCRQPLRPLPIRCLPYPLQRRLQGRPARSPIPGASKRIALGRPLPSACSAGDEAG